MGKGLPGAMHAHAHSFEREAIIARIKFLARLMDSAVKVPGTNFSIGLDPILGLAPGVGDAVSTGVSIYIWTLARRLGVPQATLNKMAFNIAADVVLGLIPIAGDAADFVFKANRRNLALLGIELDEDDQPPRPRKRV